jgi:hypothetical protein
VELYDLYSLQGVIREIKLGMLKWVGHVSGEKSTQGFGGQLKERECLGDLSINGRIILK